ncbi:MAG: hydrogenase [Terriglobia bacterium]
MFLTHLTPVENSIFSLLAVVSLLLAFVMLGSHWLENYVYAFAAESWLIAILSASIGYFGHYPELYEIAVLTTLFRGLVLPYLLMRIVRRLNVKRELHALIQPALGLVISSLLVIFAFVLATHVSRDVAAGNIVILALTVMLSMKLIGFFMLAARDEAVSQILALLVLENGIFLGSQILIPGMPILIEIVILFDLLIVVACFAVLVRYLVVHAGTTSSRQLKRLVG